MTEASGTRVCTSQARKTRCSDITLANVLSPGTPPTPCYFLVTKARKKAPAALLLFLQLVSKHLQVFFQKENFRKKASPTWIFLA